MVLQTTESGLLANQLEPPPEPVLCQPKCVLLSKATIFARVLNNIFPKHQARSFQAIEEDSPSSDANKGVRSGSHFLQKKR